MPNDVSYKNNTHKPGISIYYFPKDVAVWLKWTRFDLRHRGDFTLQCRFWHLHGQTLLMKSLCNYYSQTDV